MKRKKWAGIALSLCIAFQLGISQSFDATPLRQAKTDIYNSTGAEAVSIWQQEQAAALEKKLDVIKAELIKQTPKAKTGSIGGEWLIIGLARYKTDDMSVYFNQYYDELVSVVKANKGVLSTRKYTEYSRTILALTALGKNPADIAGYNLLTPLGDYENVLKQGMNGPIFALIALDSGNYEMPVCQTAQTKATRQLYVDYILNKQLADGGFALSGSTADPDITAMVLTALAPYKQQPRVKAALEKGVNLLAQLQNDSGGYRSYGIENVESAAQVLTALNALGISPFDERFVKNGHSLIDNILSFYKEGEGFCHTMAINAGNQMASEQAFYSLVSTWRCLQGKSSLYVMQE